MNPVITAAALAALAPLLAGTAATLAFSGKRKESAAAGLLLHSVDKKPGLSMSSYSKERFKEFLDYLKTNGIESVTVSQHREESGRQSVDSGKQDNRNFQLQVTGCRRIKAKKIAITFDDGLLSFYENAYPLLEERGLKSTVFAVAGSVGKRGNWDVMGRSSHMDARMLRKIAESGHEAASHSLTHANLVWLDDKELRKELCDSKAIIEDITGTAVKSLSFPFGSWNKRIWEAAKLAGYEYGTVYRGHKHTPPELLPVMGVYRFDKVSDIINRVFSTSLSSSRALGLIMSHFSKGSPICKFRKEYKRFPL
ncbi:MAG: polysaccharide deacetylase family protein [Chitinispirillales bacterium]|nr:polysaccharide deacetylase family protein [Chitinispirillales bacterium]